MDEVTFRSAEGNTALTLAEFNRRDEEWCTFRATLEGDGLSASCVVEDHLSLGLPDRTGTLGLVELVASTVEEYHGWEGEKRWLSLEHQLALSVASERTGLAVLTVRLTPNLYDGWRSEATMKLDVMQREQLAKLLTRFFDLRAV